MVCYINNPDYCATSNKYAKCSIGKKIAKLVWITNEDAVFDLLYRHFAALDTKQTFQPAIAKCIGVAREDMH